MEGGKGPIDEQDTIPRALRPMMRFTAEADALLELLDEMDDQRFLQIRQQRPLTKATS